MTKKFFENIQLEILNWYKGGAGTFYLNGVSEDQYGLIFHQLFNKDNSFFSQFNHLFVCKNTEAAEELFISLSSVLNTGNCNIFLYPSDQISPYTGGVFSQENLLDKFSTLSKLALLKNKENIKKRNILITDISGYCSLIPPLSFFQQNSLELVKDSIYSRSDLEINLGHLGYSREVTVLRPGTFSFKGEILDVFPINGTPCRITFYDDLIEAINEIDKDSFKSIPENVRDQIILSPAPQGLIHLSNSLNTLRKRLPVPTPQYPQKFEARKQFFNSLNEKIWPFEFNSFFHLAFEENQTLVDYFNLENTLIHFVESSSLENNINSFFERANEEYLNCSTSYDSDCFFPDLNSFYCTNLQDIKKFKKTIKTNSINYNSGLDSDKSSSLSINMETASVYLNRIIGRRIDQKEYLKSLFEHINTLLSQDAHIFFITKSEKVLKEIQFLIDNSNISSESKEQIFYIEMNISEGAYSQYENSLFLTDKDIFGSIRSESKKVKSKKIDLFAEQISSLAKGDYIIHCHHGIGKFISVSTLNIAGQNNDYVILEYEDGDKIYVPVYKLNLIQKHAESGQNIKIANLKNNKFEQIKLKAKESAKKLAFDLIKMQAERANSKAFQFSAPDHYFQEFELAFPFNETEDQLRAIQEVLDDLQKEQPMDRLICGDVGFGKTEVAMRAAFKAVQDRKQVAILVPTTILAFQHFHTFSRRFNNFPVKIEYLSRFKTATEVKKILADLKDGKIDIIIGTHKILSSNVEFHDLGLVIVDEEQRFGVNHKEKLKSLKKNVAFLTLTATPIPRTLQLAYMGIRDLSIIQTPPSGRQTIQSLVLKNDPIAIKTAIEKEIERGGQVFYVHNRVSDIEIHVAKIRELVPSAKISVAHGQLLEKELEKVMLKFYKGESNVLVATTIIESGLDIPNANTIIIDRADHYGLSQLHQLRGRIGRSEKKAYAYFIIPHNTILSEMAQKRIKALQTYTEFGSGFSLASADLDIRGAGDILGADQSGHISEVGLELYLELLNEAISELKNEKTQKRREIEIQLQIPAFIPHQYISDSSLRLKYYKKLSNCIDELSLESIKSEMKDIFGQTPEELNNLITILMIRNVVHNLGVINIRASKNIVHLKFEKAYIEKNYELNKKLIALFISRPKVYQFTPDYSVIYKHKNIVDANELLDISKDIAHQVEPC